MKSIHPQLMNRPLEFILPDFTLFQCPFHGPTLADYEEQIHAHVPADALYSIIPSFRTRADEPTALSPSSQLSAFQGRRLYLRYGAPKSVEIPVVLQNEELAETITAEVHSTDQVRKLLRLAKREWGFAVSLKLGADLLDPHLTIGDIGIACGESLTVFERHTILYQKPTKATPEKLLIPVRLPTLAALSQLLKLSPSERLLADGAPIKSIAEVYSLSAKVLLTVVADYIFVTTDRRVIASVCPSTPVFAAAQAADVCHPHERENVLFVSGWRTAAPTDPIGSCAREIFVIQRGMLMMIRCLDPVNKRLTLSVQQDYSISNLIVELKKTRSFSNATRIAVFAGEVQAKETDPVILFTKFDNERSLRCAPMRRYAVQTADGQFAQEVELAETLSVREAHAQFAREMGRPLFIQKDGVDAALTDPVGKVAVGGVLTVRFEAPSLRLLLPDGTAVQRQVSEDRTFASLVDEFPDFDAAFFDGELRIDPEATVGTVNGRPILVRMLHAFVCRDWEGIRREAFAETATVADVISALTGKQAREFIACIGSARLALEQTIGSLNWARDQCLRLARVFPVQFRVAESGETFEREFEENCTFTVMKAIIEGDKRQSEVVLSAEWPPDAEIYSVLALSDVVTLRASNPLLWNLIQTFSLSPDLTVDTVIPALRATIEQPHSAPSSSAESFATLAGITPPGANAVREAESIGANAKAQQLPLAAPDPQVASLKAIVCGLFRFLSGLVGNRELRTLIGQASFESSREFIVEQVNALGKFLEEQAIHSVEDSCLFEAMVEGRTIANLIETVKSCVPSTPTEQQLWLSLMQAIAANGVLRKIAADSLETVSSEHTELKSRQEARESAVAESTFEETTADCRLLLKLKDERIQELEAHVRCLQKRAAELKKRLTDERNALELKLRDGPVLTQKDFTQLWETFARLEARATARKKIKADGREFLVFFQRTLADYTDKKPLQSFSAAKEVVLRVKADLGGQPGLVKDRQKGMLSANDELRSVCRAQRK
jgi:hypothetical protein